jgi:hypothetical protein
MIGETNRAKFKRLVEAAKSGALYLVEAPDAKTGSPVLVIGFGRPHGDQGDLEFFPLARIMEDDEVVWPDD